MDDDPVDLSEESEVVDAGRAEARLEDGDALGDRDAQDLGLVAVGQPVSVRLLDGRTVEGRIDFISNVADAKIRSFRVEAEVAPARGVPNAGISAELRIEAGAERVRLARRRPKNQASNQDDTLTCGHQGKPRTNLSCPVVRTGVAIFQRLREDAKAHLLPRIEAE